MLDASLRALRSGPSILAAVDDGALAEAFGATVAVFRERDSPERRRLDPLLAHSSGLSAPLLDASLDALLAGFADGAVERVLAAGRERRSERADSAPIVVLSANVPGVGLQALLAALALRRPVFLKSSSREPHFHSHWVEALVRRLPALADAIVVRAWEGGRRDLEDRLFELWSPVVVYGGADVVADLGRRVPRHLLLFGPRTSLAVVAGCEATELPEIAGGLARDTVLFEQRGCLSVRTVFADRAAVPTLASELVARLESLASRFGPIVDRATLAAVHRARALAQMRGARVLDLEARAGTVVVDPNPAPELGPPGRFVTVQGIESVADLAEALRGFRGALQGAVLARHGAESYRTCLAELGVSRFAPPGSLQSAPADWRNDGVDLLEAFAAAPG